jgi:Tfp pilus assembly ATPase PilU
MVGAVGCRGGVRSTVLAAVCVHRNADGAGHRRHTHVRAHYQARAGGQ